MAVSLWDEARFSFELEPAVGRLEFDVVIIGGGYTGLWTALELVESKPDLRVGILEKHHIGFGASGRNGGWCSSILPMSLHRIAATHGSPMATRMQETMMSVVDDIGENTRRLGIECDYAKGGTVSLARNTFQVERADAEITESREFGLGDDHLRRLDAEATERILRTSGRPISNFQSGCAALHPRKLIDGLARVALERGVTIHENSPVIDIAARSVRTDRANVVARSVLVCTEGYTVTLPTRRRHVAPLYSLMIATEPLTEDQWTEIGLAERTTFADHRHLIIYGQRTADGRLAFGGRGAPYHFGSRIDERFDTDDSVKQHLITELRMLFPSLDNVRITHHWGGPLAIPRDWTFSVDYDRHDGIGRAGGYVGDGVATSHLAGRTLADLVLGRDTPRTALPFVSHRSRRWEPEPLRWAAINGMARLAARMDRVEGQGRRPSRLIGSLIDRVTGS